MNLVLLAVLVSGRVSGRQLFPDKTYPVDEWRATAMLWRSQLPYESWRGMVSSIALSRGWEGGKREIHLRPNDGSGAPAPPSDMFWTYRYPPDHEWRTRPGTEFSWEQTSTGYMRTEGNFQCSVANDILTHALEPFARTLRSAIVTFHAYHDWPQDGAVSAAHALINLWLTAGTECDSAELSAAYDTCLRIALRGFSPNDHEGRNNYRLLVLRQLIADRDRLPTEFLRRAVDQIRAEEEADDRPFGPGVAELANQLLSEATEETP